MISGKTASGLALIVATLAAATGYVAWKTPGNAGPDTLDLARSGTLVYVDATGVVRQGPLEQPRQEDVAGPACHRVHIAAQTMICLRAGAAPMSSIITVHDEARREVLRLTEWGTPSRARISPSGNLVTWTVFRTGDSYLVAGAFATTAGIYHLRTGAHYGSLEDFAVLLDGQPYSSPDVNFWGVTFTGDDNTFYATMASKGRTWLVRGDLATRTLTTIRGNVECPSLAPRGTHLAYKKKIGDQWRLHVLDLRDGSEVALAETSHVDDQAVWLDERTVGYARPYEGRSAIFAVPADGSGAPRLLRAGASSPVQPR